MSYKEDIKEISNILDQLISLLKSANENERADVLWRLRCDCEFAENEQDTVRIRWFIRRLYGGQGSFFEYALWENGDFHPEHERFDQLSTKLYDTVINQLVKKASRNLKGISLFRRAYNKLTTLILQVFKSFG